MFASVAGDILIGLVLAGVVLGGTALAAVLVWRSLRRRWRLLATHAAARTASGLWTGAAALLESVGAGSRLSAGHGDISTWPPARSRREVRRAVDEAEAAVRGAADAGAPVGELPDLCRRLRAGAQDLDRLLATGGDVRHPRSGVGVLQPQVAEVLSASSSIRRAAVTAAGDATGPRLASLADDADREVRCLSAGVASARTSVPHPGA